jgi:hypothetical protein
MPAVEDEKENFIADSHAHKECLNLPKIKLRKFSGKVKEWLGFWSHFNACMMTQRSKRRTNSNISSKP